MVIGWRYTPYGCIAPAPPGGCTRGVSAERFETPLVGGAARFWRLGGNPPTPAFPREGETGKGAIQIPCCRRLITSAAAPGICRPTATPQVLTATQKPEFPRYKKNGPTGKG